MALFLVFQGVPQTLAGAVNVTTLEGGEQTITRGLVASLESIKHIGTNGGGWFGTNAAHPFENPTALANLVHIVCMMLLPTALVYAFGLMVNNRKQGWALFAAMSFLFLVMLTTVLYRSTAVYLHWMPPAFKAIWRERGQVWDSRIGVIHRSDYSCNNGIRQQYA